MRFFFFFSSLLGTRWGPADSARERGGMHLNMKRLGSVLKETRSDESGCHITRQILSSVVFHQKYMQRATACGETFELGLK